MWFVIINIRRAKSRFETAVREHSLFKLISVAIHIYTFIERTLVVLILGFVNGMDRGIRNADEELLQTRVRPNLIDLEII